MAWSHWLVGWSVRLAILMAALALKTQPGEHHLGTLGTPGAVHGPVGWCTRAWWVGYLGSGYPGMVVPGHGGPRACYSGKYSGEMGARDSQAGHQDSQASSDTTGLAVWLSASCLQELYVEIGIKVSKLSKLLFWCQKVIKTVFFTKIQ